MLRPRWIKLIREVQAAPGRLLITLLAMAAGVFGLATLLSSYTLLTREVSRNYLSTQPASASIQVEGIDPALLAAVRQFPGVDSAQAGAILHGVIIGATGEHHPLTIFVVEDFHQISINTFFAEAGAWPPLPNTLLLERNSLKVLNAHLDDKVQLQVQGREIANVKVSGTAHDPAQAFSNYLIYAYADINTLQSWGLNSVFTEINIRVRDQPFNARAIEHTASQLALWLQQQGHTIGAIRIPPPGEHPHQAIMFGVISAFLIFSAVSFVLATVLMATMIDGLLAQQVWQIGVMKTIGASARQIAAVYLSCVFILSVLASLLGIPSGIAFGRNLSQGMLVNWMNFNVQSLDIPLGVCAVLIIAGVMVPMAIASVPIIYASRGKIHLALSRSSTGQSSVAASRSGVALFNNRVLSMAARNCLRRRGRLLLVVGLLACAGAMSMASLNTRHAAQLHLVAAANQRHYDLEIQLASRADPKIIMDILRTIPGVVQVEPWNKISAARHRVDGINITTTYPDGGHGLLQLSAINPASNFITLPMRSGRMLEDNNSDEVVLNQKALESYFFGDARERADPIGAEIFLGVGGHAARLRIVGLAEQTMTGGMAYVSAATFQKLTGQDGYSTHFRVQMSDSAAEKVDAVAKQIETTLAQQHFYVIGSIPEQRLRYEVDGHFTMLINALLDIAVLMALVGLIGLGSALNSQIAERTREFAIMRSIGAGDGIIKRIVIVEGVLMCLISWFFALVLALPLTLGLNEFLGFLLFGEAFLFTLSQAGIATWLLISLGGAVAASLYPAYKALRINVQQSLAVC